MKKLLLVLFVSLFVFTGYSQVTIIERGKQIDGWTYGKPGFYEHLDNDAKRKILSYCLTKMDIDTTYCIVVTDDDMFHKLKKDSSNAEFSILWIETMLDQKENKIYTQNTKEPYYLKQKTNPVEVKPKVFIDYFLSDNTLNFRVYFKR